MSEETNNILNEIKSVSQKLNKNNKYIETLGLNKEEIKMLNNYIEQLQQENTDLQIMVNFPSLKITTCPKCGEKYSINYCKEVYKLEEENKELKEQIKLFKKDLAKAENICQKYNSRYYDEKLILIKFEKWLKEKLFDRVQIYYEYSLALRRCYDKLQELKEGKNNGS